MAGKCTHLDQIRHVEANTEGCEECMKIGQKWVHLRKCLICGHVGCCNSSIGKHAQKHFEETGHPLVQAFGTDEDWKWCYIDKTYV